MRRATKAGSDHINLERQLREIARDKRYWEQKRDRIRLTDRKIEELEQSYAAQLARIRQERSEILRAAKAEARELVAEANRRIEQTIKEIREAQAEPREMTRFIRRDLDAFKERVEQADAVDAEKAARIEREMEKLRRRRERREERRRQPVAVGDAQPSSRRRAKSRSARRWCSKGSRRPAWCSRSRATRCRWPSASC